MTANGDAAETWRVDALAANIPNLLANDAVPVRFGERYGWIALPRELAVQIVKDHNAATWAREAKDALAVTARRWHNANHPAHGTAEVCDLPLCTQNRDLLSRFPGGQ